MDVMKLVQLFRDNCLQIITYLDDRRDVFPEGEDSPNKL